MLTVPQHARPVVGAYAENVIAFADKIDPNQELDWTALWIGWALARGLRDVDALSERFYMDYVFPIESMDVADIIGPVSDAYRAYLSSPFDPRD